MARELLAAFAEAELDACKDKSDGFRICLHPRGNINFFHGLTKRAR